MTLISFITLCLSFLPLFATTSLATDRARSCRSYCGNITVDYPFSLDYGCGHPGFRDLLFCMNDVLMFHISSGSYRVLDIDYAYQALTLHDPHMSTCDTIVLGGRGNGFEVEQWRAPYFNPTADNVFMLIGCSAESPVFQGFPGKHLPCRNVSGMGCEEYYDCPAWTMVGHKKFSSVYGSGPPECCAVSFEAIKAINLSKLQCEGYSSAYSVAPLRVDGAGGWSYGIRVKYSVQGNDEFCRACEATGGACGFGTDGVKQLCMCGSFNSTTNCDSESSTSCEITLPLPDALAGILPFAVCASLSMPRASLFALCAPPLATSMDTLYTLICVLCISVFTLSMHLCGNVHLSICVMCAFFCFALCVSWAPTSMSCAPLYASRVPLCASIDAYAPLSMSCAPLYASRVPLFALCVPL
ncbi:hypothetical protein V6N11_055422 [Hibiscus sabdariffa]|uniref:Wall-associated receptor kinase galacturonan-binding domain-containing protein n=1 Tax=Hibiscus sabdariffa TaxID=183260 RepID=A0ABR2PFL4_9ROSI